MARNVETPQDVDITSMRKEYVAVGNLLQPGPGTPWEDRGAIGVIPAYFKTVIMSMTSPGRLFQSLRRPETPGDSGPFAAVCAALWGLSWVIYDVINAYIVRNKPDFEWMDVARLGVLHFAIGAGGAWILYKLIARVFFRLASAGEMRARFPAILATNVYAYCMGPSILALVPVHFIGPGLAIAWMFLLCVNAAINRLAIHKKGAIICNAIAFAGLIGGGFGLYKLIMKVLSWQIF